MTIDQLKAWIDANIDTNGTSAITGAVMNEALTNIVETFIRLSQQGQLADWSDTTEYVPLNFAQYVYYDGAVYKFVSPTVDTGTTPGTDTDVWVVSNPYDLIHTPNTDFNLQVYKKEVEVSGTDLDLSGAGAVNYFEIINGSSIETFTMNEGDNIRFWLQNKTVASIVIAASSLIMLKGVDAITLRPDDIVEFTAIGNVVYLNDDSIGSKVIRDGEKIIMGEGANPQEIGTDAAGNIKFRDSEGTAVNPIDNSVLVPSLVVPTVKYGYLYNWFVGTNAKKVFSSDDWDNDRASYRALITYLGGAAVAGGILKEAGILHWATNAGGTNLYNTSFRGSGSGMPDNFVQFRTHMHFWAKEDDSNLMSATCFYVYGTDPEIVETTQLKTYGKALRPIRAADVTEQTYPDGTSCAPYTGNDGQTYPTVKVGAYVILACNLAETKYRTGELIPYGNDLSAWAADTSGLRCFPNGQKTNVYYFAFQDYQTSLKTLNYEAPAADIDSGTATDGSTTELEDTAKTWTVDEHIGKVVEITPADGTAPICGLVLSNTADTLTFDDTLDQAVVATDTYRILNTVEIPDDTYIVAFDVFTNTNDCAAVLPRSTDLNERKKIITYIEMGNGDKVTVMAQGTDRVGGQKCYALEAKMESVTILPHQWNTPHFDISEQFNIQRVAGWFWNDDTAVPATLNILQLTTKITLDQARRFRIYNDGKYDWIEYTYQFEFLFIVRAFLTVAKSAGAGDMYIAVRHYIKETDTTEDLTDRLSASTFGARTGTQQLSISVPVVLNRGDRIALIGDASSNTFLVKTGSHAEIK